MVSYVILISIALVMGAGVYVWLKDYTNIKPISNCDEGTYIVLESYDCDEININLNIKNNGLFSIDGIITQVSRDADKEPTELLNAGAIPGEYLFRTSSKRIENIPYSSLVSKWELDDNLRDSKNNNHGKFCNNLACDTNPTPTYDDGDIFGNALSFNGTDNYVEVPYDDSLYFTDKFSIIAYFKRETGSSSNQPIVFKDGSYYLEIKDNKLICYGETSSPGAIGIQTSSTDISEDEWHYVVCTFDGTDWNIYLDNGPSPYETAPDPGILVGTANPLKIGSDDSEYFKGLIAEASLYNKALTTEEIDSIYNNAKRLNPDEKTTVIYTRGGTIEKIQIQPFIYDEKGDKVMCQDSVIKQDIEGC